MEIKRNDNRFYLEEYGEFLGEMTFVPSGEDKIIIDHTYVPDKFGGRGYGKILLKEIVNYARENNKKILATCSYALYQLNKTDEYDDVFIK